MARQPPGRECRDLKYVRARRQNHAFISPTRDPKEFPHEVLHTEARRRGRCRLHSSGTASASGGGSGPNVQYAVQGKIGEVITNPYKIAPLTAVIRNGGYQLKDAAVRIVPKHGGSRNQVQRERCSAAHPCGHPGLRPLSRLQQHGRGVLHARRRHEGNPRRNEVYRIYAPGIHTETNGTAAQHHAMFETEVKKVAPEFKDRLYFINNFLPSGGNVARTTWNNPMAAPSSGSTIPQNAVIDTAGDVRWYMFVSPIYDPENIYKSGIMMGFHQADDGFLTFGYGQRYAKYDLMGREVFNRRLPAGYADFSHAMDPAQNGHYFLARFLGRLPPSRRQARPHGPRRDP